MSPRRIIDEIIAAFRQQQQELSQRGQPRSRGEWTQTVLTTLCKLGQGLGYTTWATSRRPYRIPSECCDGDEWLYDVCWLQYPSDDPNHTWLISVPMVAECEWGNLGDIEQDFSKLLLARATVRVMVYDSWRFDRDPAVINNRLCELVSTFNGAPGDIYLLIAMAYDDESFKFSTIRVDDTNTPILAEIDR